MGKTVILQIVNLLFNLTPLTRWYRFRAKLLAFAGVNCAPTARIVASVRIVLRNVSIGEDTFIGHQVLITGGETTQIVIGNYVDIAPRVCIVSGSHQIDMQGQHVAGQGNSLAIVIEDGAWIGAGCTIIGGITIGQKSIIGAGSVVVRDIPPFTIAVGNPCHPIKQWDNFTQNWINLSTKLK